MTHWFTRWLALTYAVHLGAQVAGSQAILWLFGIEIFGWLRENRPITALVLGFHFVCYLVGKLASIERDYLDERARERLRDD